MRPSKFFRFCPRCGREQASIPPGNAIHCPACGFHYYFNPTVGVVVFARRADGRTLFIRRGKDPARGRLAAPGGFIDFGETAEAAALREIREEVGLEIQDLTFLCSEANQYPYGGVTYEVLDLYFIARAANADDVAPDLDEVESCVWLDPLEVPPHEMAFVSMERALARWQAQLRGLPPQPPTPPPG